MLYSYMYSTSSLAANIYTILPTEQLIDVVFLYVQY